MTILVVGVPLRINSPKNDRVRREQDISFTQVNRGRIVHFEVPIEDTSNVIAICNEIFLVLEEVVSIVIWIINWDLDYEVHFVDFLLEPTSSSRIVKVVHFSPLINGIVPSRESFRKDRILDSFKMPLETKG